MDAGVKRSLLKVLILPAILLLSLATVLGAPYNISCNEDLSSGTYDLIDDVACAGNSMFHAEDEAEIIINCQGHSLTLSASGSDFVTLDNITNITIRDCTMTASNSPDNLFHIYDYDFLLVENNSLYSYVGLYLEANSQPPLGTALHINDNHFQYTSQNANYNAIVMTALHNDSVGSLPPTIDISHNLFNISGVGFPPTLRNRTILGAEQPVSDPESVYSTWNISSSVGNYYTYYLGDTWNTWNCTDGDTDGFCDDPWYQDNSGIGVTSYYDYFALSEYPYAPCIPDWSCDGYASCNTSDLAPCNSATDNNACGENYTGDYSEFSPQACNYCSSDVVYVTETGCHAVTDLKTVYYTDNNFEACCNVTGLPADCPQNESLVGIETSCSFFNYDEDDITGASIDVVAKGMISFSKLAGLFIMFVILGAGFVYMTVKLGVKK